MDAIRHFQQAARLANDALHGTLPVWIAIYAYMAAVAVWLAHVVFERWRARRSGWNRAEQEAIWTRMWVRHRRPVNVLAVVATAASIAMSTLLGAAGLEVLGTAIGGQGVDLLAGVGQFLGRIALSFYAMVTGVGAFIAGMLICALGDSLLPAPRAITPAERCLQRIEQALAQTNELLREMSRERAVREPTHGVIASTGNASESSAAEEIHDPRA